MLSNKSVHSIYGAGDHEQDHVYFRTLWHSARKYYLLSLGRDTMTLWRQQNNVEKRPWLQQTEVESIINECSLILISVAVIGISTNSAGRSGQP